LSYKPDGSRNFLYSALHNQGDLHITVSAMDCMPTMYYVLNIMLQQRKEIFPFKTCRQTPNITPVS